MAIYDTMQYVKCDVSTICMGMGASRRTSSSRLPQKEQRRDFFVSSFMD